MRKHIYTLAKETDLLSREIDELEYKFDFDFEIYAYQAIVLRKLDKNLLEAHQRLVPDLVGEDSFWRNYFYEIELYKQELGVHSRLGPKIEAEEQAQREEKVDNMYASHHIREVEEKETQEESSPEVSTDQPTMEMVELVKQESTEILDGETEDEIKV